MKQNIILTGDFGFGYFDGAVSMPNKPRQYVNFRSVTALGTTQSDLAIDGLRDNNGNDKPATVIFDGNSYLVGGAIDNFSTNGQQQQELTRFNTPTQLLPLLYRAAANLGLGDGEEVVFATALPLTAFLKKETRTKLPTALINMLQKEHEFSILEHGKEVKKRFTITKVIVEQPQPYYALASLYTDELGLPLAGDCDYNPETNAIITVSGGAGTLEIFTMVAGKMVKHLCKAEELGTNNAAKSLMAQVRAIYKTKISLSQANQAMESYINPTRNTDKNGKINIFVGGKPKDIRKQVETVVETYRNDAMSFIMSIINEVYTTYAIALVGGVAYYIKERMTSQFSEVEVRVPAKPEQAVIAGLTNKACLKIAASTRPEPQVSQTEPTDGQAS